MVRTEISLFLKNVPGELGRLASLFSDENVNIDALTIQDASSYVKNLFEARGKSLKRIASVASYNSMRKDSAEFALIRMLVDQTEKAINLLSKNDFIFDTMPVITLELENKPGALAAVANKFGEEGININYVYGTVSSPDEKCLFVFCPEDIDRGSPAGAGEQREAPARRDAPKVFHFERQHGTINRGLDDVVNFAIGDVDRAGLQKLQLFPSQSES